MQPDWKEIPWGAVPTKCAVGAEGRWENIRANIAKTEKRFRAVEGALHGIFGEVAIVCFGPSLLGTWPALARGSEMRLPVVTTSGAHDFLLSEGLVPNFHVEMDPRPERAKFTTAPHPDVTYLIGSSCHPSVLDRLDGFNAVLWHPYDDQNAEKVFEIEPDAEMIQGGSNVGLRAIGLFYAQGYRRFSVFGMDCSFSEDGTQYTGGHPGKQKNVVSVKCGERVFKTSPILTVYARQFLGEIKRLEGADFNLHGDGLLQEMARIGNEKAAA